MANTYTSLHYQIVLSIDMWGTLEDEHQQEITGEHDSDRRLACDGEIQKRHQNPFLSTSL